MKKCFRALIGLLVLMAAIWGVYAYRPPHRLSAPEGGASAPFSHVFIIIMENRGTKLIGSPQAPYLTRLARTYGYESNYYGVTHPSLPNYLALISGTTGGTHSDNPTQRFPVRTLVTQFLSHHITFQAAMQNLPRPGYLGNWYPPGPAGNKPATMPLHALYAKKHNPFLLVPDGIAAKRHVVPLKTLAGELKAGDVPRFVWITPNLCNDMHGQPDHPGAACPAGHVEALVRQGDAFVQKWVPKIMHSPAWTGNAAIFIVWDENDLTSPWYLPQHIRRYLDAGPASPALIPAIPQLGAFGGGKVPLIVIAREGPHPLVVRRWTDHYSLLRTIEQSWHLPYLGNAARVSSLAPFFPKK